MEGLNEVKVMRDPIHGYIHIREKIIWDLIGTREFQRLRRIRQLGSTSMVYHTGEHSRFSHSLGVYEIVRRMIEENKDLSSSLDPHEKVVALCAGLLHDLGHGPFSHTFEKISGLSHEEYTCRILLGKSEVHEVLAEYDERLPEEVASVVRHVHEDPILIQMIGSQLDADRMDYLLRDAYFTGTSYGTYDLERILRTLRVRDGKLVVKESGIHSIEDYIMARYHMYWQVYFHPVCRSYDAVFHNLFRRMEDVHAVSPEYMDDYPMFVPLLENRELGEEEFFEMDDSAFEYGFVRMREHAQDPVMRDLADRLVGRKLFAYSPVESVAMANEYYRWIASCGFDPEYYMYVDERKQSPYQPYQKEDDAIWILMEDGQIRELSEASPIVRAVMDTEQDEKKVFYPRECEE